MTVDNEIDLEPQLAEWRAHMRRRRAVGETDVEELEDHLRAVIDELVAVGLRPDEAFLVAVKRMGGQDELSREFAVVHSERLWKQLVLAGDPTTPQPRGGGNSLLVAIGFAALAAIGVKAPELFGMDPDRNGDFYLHNLGLFALVPVAAYIAVRRRVSAAVLAVMAACFAVGGVAINAYPMADDSQTIVLCSVHLPLALWFVVGIAYVGEQWRSHDKWMDFIRFSGELLIYYVLIALVGGMLLGVTTGVFDAIGLNLEDVTQRWLLPCGAVGAVVISAWLVEAKQSVIENMAPVLTRLFTPLFSVALLAFLGAMIWTGNPIDVKREVLILFDLLLVVVFGLQLYSISARDPQARPALFDRLMLGLGISALLIDVLVLVTMAGRISEMGATPNKAAALGENIVLLASLAWTAVLFVGFLRRRRPFQQVERWQTRYLAVQAAWLWAVVLILPPAFAFA